MVKYNFTLYLLGEKGFHVLKSILEQNFQYLLSKVIIGKDKNILKDYSDEIEQICLNANLDYFFRNEDFEVTSLYSIAISWRWLISTKKSKLIVLHDSILPKYRGFAPLVNQLINKERYIGVSAIYASEDYDEGDVIAFEKIQIDYPIKINSAINLISPLYSKLVIDIFNKIIKGKLDYKTQNNKLSTYSLWRDEEDYSICWNNSSGYIKRFIDSVGFPYKGARSILNGEVIVIHEAEISDDVEIVERNKHIGKVIFVEDIYPKIICGNGILKILKANYYKTKESALPLKKFRSRFK